MYNLSKAFIHLNDQDCSSTNGLVTYIFKVNSQIEWGSFITLPRDVTKSLEKKIDEFVLKWENLKVLNKRWVKYIRSGHTKPGSMYGLIKTHQSCKGYN